MIVESLVITPKVSSIISSHQLGESCIATSDMQALFSTSNPTAFNALINLGQVGTGCVSLWCCKQWYDVLWWLLFQCYGRLSVRTFQFVLTWIEHLRSCNPISTVWITADGRWMVIWIYQSYDEGKMLQPVESLKDWFESLKDQLFYLFIYF